MAGLSLLQRKFEDVFRGVLKLTDNAPINGVLRTVTDGEGNDTALQVSSSSVAINGTIGFNGTTPAAKPTITGSRGGNAALASLLTALAATGLITDSTTA